MQEFWLIWRNIYYLHISVFIYRSWGVLAAVLLRRIFLVSTLAKGGMNQRFTSYY